MPVITRVPDVIFKTRVRDESVGGPNPFRWHEVSSKDIFADKKIVLFSLPGAFTPTCSSNHLPRYEELYESFKAEGVDQIICLSVNDAFVMYQWGQKIGAQNVFLLPDGEGTFTRQMGMLMNFSHIGFGYRSWRYSMLVENGEIKKIFEEAGKKDLPDGDPFEVSDADTMLAFLKGEKPSGIAKPKEFIG